ncbi:MAG: GntR family transcriptional regulator [Chitinophagales bacterium]
MARQIRKSSLVEQIRAVLREEIVSLRLAPGQKLNVISLSEQFGVSRTPIRDALQLLVEEGLVVVAPRVGWYVVKLSDDDVREISGIRKMIELFAFDQARLPLAAVEEMRRATLALKEVPPAERRRAFERLDRKFHLDLIRSAGNNRLFEFSARIHAFVDVMRNLNRRVDEALEEHLAILEALYRGDREGARRALAAHLDAVTGAILAARAPGGESAGEAAALSREA